MTVLIATSILSFHRDPRAGGAGFETQSQPASSAATFTLRCDAPYLGNLYWTVCRLSEADSEHRRYWDKRFGLDSEDLQALERFARTREMLKSRFRAWERSLLISPPSGAMEGLFIAAATSVDLRVLTAMSTVGDLGTVRGHLPDLSFEETNVVVGTCVRFAREFDQVWGEVSRRQQDTANEMTKLWAAQSPKIGDYIARAARVYGVMPQALDEKTQFRVHLLWSPQEHGGQCMMAENDLFCETSTGESSARYLVGLLHEVCHYLSALTPAQHKARRTQSILRDGAFFPLNLIEEALATSLGEGLGSSLIAPRLFSDDQPWVGHLEGRVDRVARTILPMVRSLHEGSRRLEPEHMTLLSRACREALAPRPADYTTVSLVAGEKGLRDYLRKGISRSPGLRYGVDLGEIERVEQGGSLPSWVNRVYLISSDDLKEGMPLLQQMRWGLPIERDQLSDWQMRHKRFVFAKRHDSRYDFLLFAEDTAGLRAVIDVFKAAADVTEGVLPIAD